MGITRRITVGWMHLKNIHEQRTLASGLIGAIKYFPLYDACDRRIQFSDLSDYEIVDFRFNGSCDCRLRSR